MKKIIFFTSMVLHVFCATAQNVLKIQSGAVIKTTGGALITLQNIRLRSWHTNALADYVLLSFRVPVE